MFSVLKYICAYIHSMFSFIFVTIYLKTTDMSDYLLTNHSMYVLIVWLIDRLIEGLIDWLIDFSERIFFYLPPKMLFLTIQLTIQCKMSYS